MKKIILFTFDYELFLGARSGKVQHCMIDPTNRLLDLFGRYHFKSIFFVDTVYLLKLREVAKDHEAARKDEEAIYKQLQSIVKEGHYIFPHLHPHWLDAEYHPETNEWSLKELRYYKFSDISGDEQERLFDASVQLIKEIVQPVNAGYVIDAYRAGGWSIQPFDVFRPHFLKHGIRHEFSVLPGKYCSSNAQSYDFRTAPPNASVYRFSNNVCEQDKNGSFTEWTISILNFSRFEKWLNFKVTGFTQRLLGKPQPTGTTVSSIITEQGDRYCNNNSYRAAASFEGLNPFNLLKYISAIRKCSYYHFISHPKLISRMELVMIKFLFSVLAKRHKSIETDFRKVSH